MGRLTRISNRSFLWALCTLLIVLVTVLVIWPNAHSKEIGQFEDLYRAHVGYLNQKGTFPAIVMIGTQPQSWRVVMYPWITNDGFLGRYDTSKPFDSVENISAIENRASNGRFFGECYSSKLRDFQVSRHASILRITGSGTLGIDGRLNPPDGAKFTILAVECQESTSLWTSTTDFDLSRYTDAELDQWLHNGSRIAIFSNGDIRRFKRSISGTEFRSFCSASGNDAVDLTKTELVKSCVLFGKE